MSHLLLIKYTQSQRDRESIFSNLKKRGFSFRMREKLLFQFPANGWGFFLKTRTNREGEEEEEDWK